MGHVEDRWTSPTGHVDGRGRPIREPNARWKIGSRWIATWIEGGQRRSRSFETKDAAVAHLSDVTKAQREGTHVNSHKMTVAEYGDGWVNTQIHQRPSTREQMEIRWRRHIRPTLGHLLLREVTKQHVQSAVLKWSAQPDPLAPATIAVTYGYVAALFKAAVDDRLVGVTPCVRINLPADVHARVKPLTAAQVHAIADRITPRYKGLVLLGAATGMRSGELRGLTTDRVRIESDGSATVRVDRQLVTTKPTWGPPKTSRSNRDVTIDPIAVTKLNEHTAAYPPHESGLIFTGREAGPLARTSIATAWASAIEGMELPDRSGLHALRHFHASLLIAAGISVTAVADRLGHQDPTQTLQVYSHLWPNDEARSREAIASGLWA